MLVTMKPTRRYNALMDIAIGHTISLLGVATSSAARTLPSLFRGGTNGELLTGEAGLAERSRASQLQR